MKKTYKRKNNNKTYKRNNKKTYKRKNKRKKTYNKNKQSGGSSKFKGVRQRPERHDPLNESVQASPVTYSIPDEIPEYKIQDEFYTGVDDQTVCYKMTNNMNATPIYIRWRILKKVFKEFVGKNRSKFGKINPRKHLKLSNKYRKIYPGQAGFKEEIDSRIRELNGKLRFINSNKEYKDDFYEVLNENLYLDPVGICFNNRLYKEILPSSPDLINHNFIFDRNTRYCVCSMEVGYPVHAIATDFHFFVAFEGNSNEGNGRILTLGFNSTNSERVRANNLGAYSKLFPNQLPHFGNRWEEGNNDTGSYTCMDFYTSCYKLNDKGLFGPFEGDNEYNKFAFTNVECFERMLFNDWLSLSDEERTIAERLGLNKEYWNKKYYQNSGSESVSFNIEGGNLLTRAYESLNDEEKAYIRKLTRFNPSGEGYVDIVRDKATWEYKKQELSHPYTNGCKIRKVVEWKNLSDVQILFMNKMKEQSNIYLNTVDNGNEYSIYQMKYELFTAHDYDCYPEYPWIISHKQLLDEIEEENGEILKSLELMKESVEFVSKLRFHDTTFDDMTFDEAINTRTVWDVKDFCVIQTNGFNFCCMEGSILFHNLDNLDNKEVIIDNLGKEITEEEIKALRDISSSSDSGSDSNSDSNSDMEEAD